MNWNLQGEKIIGTYLDGLVTISGLVELSRVCYGGSIEHHVKIDEGFSVLDGKIRRDAGESLIISHKNVLRLIGK